MATLARPQSAYRTLVKALKKHVSPGSGSPAFQQFVADEFRKNSSLSPDVAEEKLKLAEDYAALISGVHDHWELLMSYNIAVDREAERRARLMDTAHRVGLRLPTEAADEGSKAPKQGKEQVQGACVR